MKIADKKAELEARKRRIAAFVDGVKMATRLQIAAAMPDDTLRQVERALEQMSAADELCFVYFKGRGVWVLPRDRSGIIAEAVRLRRERVKAQKREQRARARLGKPRSNGRPTCQAVSSAIKDANRRAVMLQITKAGHVGVTRAELREAVKIGRSALLRHLQALRDDGLAERTEKRGTNDVYWGMPGIAALHAKPKAKKSPGRPRKNPHDLAPREAECLALIRATDGISKTELSRRLGVDKATVATWCARLRRLDLIHSTCPAGGNQQSLWRDGSSSAGSAVHVPAFMCKQVPSIFALGAME